MANEEKKIICTEIPDAKLNGVTGGTGCPAPGNLIEIPDPEDSIRKPVFVPDDMTLPVTGEEYVMIITPDL